MDKPENILGIIIRNAEKNNPPEACDYVDGDGFLVCGKCGTRRQTEITIPELAGAPATTKKVPVRCMCREEAWKREEEERLKEKELSRINSLRRQSLLEDRLLSSTFASSRENSKNAKNMKLCRRYADKFDIMFQKNQGLLFYGDVGTGKSFAAACIANALLEKKVPVVMTSFVKLLDTMQTFKEDDDLISRLNRAKLLIIDDLGAERGTDFALEKVYSIVDGRYRASLPVILTTNLSLKYMQSADDIRYARIYDRIFEMCYPMQFTGPSFRKTEAARRFETMKDFLEGSDD